MYEYALKLDEIAVETERAIDLLRVFLEFAQDEGYMNKNDTFEECKTKAFTFMKRYSVYESTIMSAFDIINSKKEEIEEIANKLYEASKKEKAA